MNSPAEPSLYNFNATGPEGLAQTYFLFARRRPPDGGARRDRTDDLMLAKHALYQLSYGPIGIMAKRAVGDPLGCKSDQQGW